MTIYNKIKNQKRKKLFLLFLRFLKDTHNVEKVYNSLLYEVRENKRQK